MNGALAPRNFQITRTALRRVLFSALDPAFVTIRWDARLTSVKDLQNGYKHCFVIIRWDARLTSVKDLQNGYKYCFVIIRWDARLPSVKDLQNGFKHCL